MEHDRLIALRSRHPAWRLLRADNAVLVLGFLGRVFVEDNVRSVPRDELVVALDDELEDLRGHEGADPYPRNAAEYLDAWAGDESAWLRKHYPPGSAEPAYDATPALEKAVGFVRSLEQVSFVGTESRLSTVVELLRQMAFGAESDPRVRLAELERRRAEIHAEIERVRAGEVELAAPTTQRDRYQQFATTARELLADLRQVEENFRRLDRGVREKITTWTGPRAALLDEVLGDRSGIADSDQGRSFGAFYDFLLSTRRQEELTDLLARVRALPEITEHDPRLRHVHHDWLAAADAAQATVRQLSDQLRRFLDDQVWLENRRVVDLLRSIERRALDLRDGSPVEVGAEVDATSVTLALPFERPLYTPRQPLVLADDDVSVASEVGDPSLMYDQVHVDPEPLLAAVRHALVRRSAVALTDVLAERPLEQGLAELVAYFSLRTDGVKTVLDESAVDEVGWSDGEGFRVARVPRLTWVRAGVIVAAPAGAQ